MFVNPSITGPGSCPDPQIATSEWHEVPQEASLGYYLIYSNTGTRHSQAEPGYVSSLDQTCMCPLPPSPRHPPSLPPCCTGSTPRRSAMAHMAETDAWPVKAGHRWHMHQTGQQSWPFCCIYSFLGDWPFWPFPARTTTQAEGHWQKWTVLAKRRQFWLFWLFWLFWPVLSQTTTQAEGQWPVLARIPLFRRNSAILAELTEYHCSGETVLFCQ